VFSKLKRIKLLGKLSWKLYQVYNHYQEVGNMGDFFRSKKAKALIIGAVTLVLVNVLDVPEETAAKLTEAIEVIFALYLGSQGIADGLSKGATSSVANGKNGE